MGTSNIEWTEQVWNPLTGCEKVSAGCREWHGMNFTDEDGKPGAYKGGRWMDATEAQLYCEDTGDRSVMFLGLVKGKKWKALLYGKEYKQYPNEPATETADSAV